MQHIINVVLKKQLSSWVMVYKVSGGIFGSGVTLENSISQVNSFALVQAVCIYSDSRGAYSITILDDTEQPDSW